MLWYEIVPLVSNLAHRFEQPQAMKRRPGWKNWLSQNPDTD